MIVRGEGGACTCPDCGGQLQLIPAAEAATRVLVAERYPTSYAATVAACTRCEWAATIVATAESGTVMAAMTAEEAR